jgi:hypothetical protein
MKWNRARAVVMGSAAFRVRSAEGNGIPLIRDGSSRQVSENRREAITGLRNRLRRKSSA